MYGLPLGTEKQLADDISFLTAWNRLPGCVAAATVQCKTDPDGLLVTIAANEGVAPEVSTGLKEIFAIVERCAARTLSRDASATACLRSAASFHRNRILGRLGSPKADQSEKWHPMKTVNVADRLR